MKTIAKSDDEWVVSTENPKAPAIGLACVAFGGAGLYYALGHLGLELREAYLALAVGLVAYGLFALTRSRRLVFRRGAREVTVRTRTLGLPRTRTFSAGDSVRVERFTRRGSGRDAHHVYDVATGDELLFSLSEYQGGEEEAARWAEGFAEFIGLRYGPPRDSEAERRRNALREKTAAYPLFLLVGAAALGALIYLTSN